MRNFDKLDRAFEMQARLNAEISERRGGELEKLSPDEWLQKLTLAMLSEMAELIDGTSFKWWKNQKALDEEYIKEEIVDIFHFFLSMCLRTGMSADELFDRYIAKHQENLDRQHDKSKKPGYSRQEELSANDPDQSAGVGTAN